MQKDIYPVNPAFSRYLQDFGRGIDLPLRYTDLLNYSHADSIKDKKGKWTHWENAVYDPSQREFLDKALVETFIALKKPASPNHSFEIAGHLIQSAQHQVADGMTGPAIEPFEAMLAERLQYGL